MLEILDFLEYSFQCLVLYSNFGRIKSQFIFQNRSVNTPEINLVFQIAIVQIRKIRIAANNFATIVSPNNKHWCGR